MKKKGFWIVLILILSLFGCSHKYDYEDVFNSVVFTYQNADHQNSLTSDITISFNKTFRGLDYFFESNKENVLSSDGQVNRTLVDEEVILTLYVKINDLTAQKDFIFIVKAKERSNHSYLVHFDPSGGVVNTSLREMIIGVSYILEIPVKVGYNFLGWYDHETQVHDGIWSIEKDLTLYAKWEAQSYLITYDPSGGITVHKTLKVTYNQAFQLETPVKEGFNFLGWYYQETKVENGLYIYFSDITIKAFWEAKRYTITYDLNGGVLDILTETVTYLENIILKVPSKEGFNFLGWYYHNQVIENGIWNIASDTTLTALWSPIDYLINLDTNGGSLAEKTLKVTFGEPFIFPIPTKTNYLFLGWYDLNTLITNGIWNHSHNMTLKAKWIGIAIDLVINIDNDLEIFKVNYDSEVTFKVPKAKKGYSFKGYKFNKTDSVYLVEIQNGLLPKITWKYLPTSLNIINIYAIYQANEYEVTFNLNGGYIVLENEVLSYFEKPVYGTLYNFLEPINYGATFIGWFYNGVKLSTSGTWEIDQNIVLEAKYDYYFNYLERANEIVVLGLKSKDIKHLRIPEFLNNKPVTKIADNAFLNNTRLLTIFIPESVMEISSNAFKGCDNLSITTKHPSNSNLFSPELNVIYDVKETYFNKQFVFSVLNTLNNPVTIIKYLLDEENIVINNGFFGDSNLVYYVASKAFKDKSSLKEVRFPNTLKEIGDYAFYNVVALRRVHFTLNLERIGNYAFYNCVSLKSFYNLNADLSVNYFPKSLREIGAYAFYNCLSLKTLFIDPEPYSYEYLWIFEYAFADCQNLTIYNKMSARPSYININYANNTKVVYDDVAYLLLDGDFLFGITSLNKAKLIKYLGQEKEVIIPLSVADFEVFAVEKYAFKSANSYLVETLKIDSNITAIYDYAFFDLINLKEAYINGNPNYYGGNVFYYSSSLTLFLDGIWNNGLNANIKVENVQRINKNAEFIYVVTKDDQIVIVKYLGDIVNLTIPKTIENFSVVGLAPRAFSNNYLIESVVLPSTLLFISEYAFYNASNLKEIVFNEGLLEINRYSLAFTKITTLELPDSLLVINSNAFDSMNFLVEVELNKVVTINYYAFNNCLNLTTINFNSQQRVIDYYAFNNCLKLAIVRLPMTITTIGAYAFYGCHNLELYTDALSSNSGWSDTFHNNRPLYYDINLDNIEIITSGDYKYLITNSNQKILYQYLGSETSIVISSDYDLIGAYAFSNNKTLKEVIIDTNIQEIGYGAFKGASDLAIYFKDAVLSGNYNLDNLAVFPYFNYKNATLDYLYYERTDSQIVILKYLKSDQKVFIEPLIAGKEVIRIAKDAFNNQSIQEIFIPKSIQEIDRNAFHHQSDLIIYSDIDQPFRTWIDIFNYPLVVLNTLKENSKIITDGDYKYIQTEAGNALYKYLGSSEIITIEYPIILKKAFSDANLKEIIISSNVIDIADDAFKNSKDLTVLFVNDLIGSSNQEYLVVTNFQELKREGDYEYIITKDDSLYIKKYLGDDPAVIVPDSYLNKPVQGILKNAFDSPHIKELILKRDLEILDKITLDNKEMIVYCYYEELNNNVFLNNTLVLGVQELKENSDYKYVITNNLEVIIVKYLGSDLEVSISQIAGLDVTKILDYAFYQKNLQKVTISGNIQDIGAYAFAFCHIEVVLFLTNTIKVIGDYAFSNNNISEVNIKQSVISLGNRVFYQNSGIIVSVAVYYPPNDWKSGWDDGVNKINYPL